jgi:hypothetical protein
VRGKTSCRDQRRRTRPWSLVPENSVARIPSPRSLFGDFSAIVSCLAISFAVKSPLHNAIADFCCLSLKLIVDIDGAGHAYETQAKRDGQRDRELKKRGYRVLRFPNGMVLKAPTEFVKKIRECIAQLEQTR